MQTFLPSPSFEESAAVLDNSRLGNQCYRETKTLLCGGWPNHPAAKMWRGHYYALALYGLATAREMELRNKWQPQIVKKWIGFWEKAVEMIPDNGMPEWLGRPAFHESHKKALLFKDYPHYSQFWPDLEPIELDKDGKIPYIWPT